VRYGPPSALTLTSSCGGFNDCAFRRRKFLQTTIATARNHNRRHPNPPQGDGRQRPNPDRMVSPGLGTAAANSTPRRVPRHEEVEVAYIVGTRPAETYKKDIDIVRERNCTPGRSHKDIRKVLEDKERNAVSIATPNHWHALMTIWACETRQGTSTSRSVLAHLHEGEHRGGEGAEAPSASFSTERRAAATQKVSPTSRPSLKSGKLGKLIGRAPGLQGTA